jgi:hypothetical protein
VRAIVVVVWLPVQGGDLMPVEECRTNTIAIEVVANRRPVHSCDHAEQDFSNIAFPARPPASKSIKRNLTV